MIEVGIVSVGENETQQQEAVGVVKGLLPDGQFSVVFRDHVQDDTSQIRRVLRQWCDQQQLALVLTVGGCELGPRENVPEVSQELFTRAIPGLSELMRLGGVQKTRAAALWRGLCGQRNKTLIVNLPAHYTGVALEMVLPLLPKIVATVRGTKENASVGN